MFDHINSIRQRDPANPTFCEVLFAYNGYHAVCIHRMSHVIWKMELRALARILANIGRFLTGVEIHPGARIGKNVFIDHGTGVVIGETAIIEDEVTLYHGVTLGGVGRSGQVNGKRHPTIKSGAMIGAGAQVLGDITVGIGSKVGSNSVVTSDIPDHKTAIGIPARVIGECDEGRAYGLPSRQEMEEITFTIDCIVREMGHIKKELNIQNGGTDCKEQSAPKGRKTKKAS